MPIESRFWRGAGFYLTSIQFQWRTARFAANPGVGATAGCLAQTEFPLTERHQGGRKRPFGQPERHQGRQEMIPRHQGGRKGSIGQLARHQGGTREAGKNHLDSLKDQLDSLRGTREAPGRQERTIWTAWEAPGRQERINWTAWRHQGGRKGSIGQLARHQGGRKEPPGQPGRHQGGTRETCSTGLPIEFRFWKGAGFCLTFNTISMANGPVRGTSWGGLHGRLPSTDWKGTREAGKSHLDSLGGTREAPGRLVAQDCRSNFGCGRAPDFV